MVALVSLSVEVVVVAAAAEVVALVVQFVAAMGLLSCGGVQIVAIATVA